MTQGGNIYRAAERQLLDAIRAGGVCDFADGAEIAADEMDSWGPERTIRAALLRRLLTAEDAEYAPDGVRLRGAVIDGVLDLNRLNVLPVELRQCRLVTVQAKHATFTGEANFNGATFTGNTGFDRATFTGDAWFGSTTFTGKASFYGATFTGDAWFAGATFTNAWFTGATFADDARFTGATFTGDTWFRGATFTSDARFDGATFTGNAGFTGANFTGGSAWFTGATFTGDATFNGTTFTGDAGFRGATFTRDANFSGALADAYDFSGAQFYATDPGPWVARRLSLKGSVFSVRAKVGVAAAKVDCGRLQAREGVHLLVRGGAVNLEDAEFLRRSILAHSGSEPAVPERVNLGERPEGFNDLTPAEQAPRRANETAFRLAQQLADELRPKTHVGSLRRATAGDLMLSGVGLEDCAFAGAHGLDKLRIDATCSFQRPPAWPSRTWRLFTGRQVIFEEAQWRQVHTRGWAPTFTTPAASAKPSDPVPTALEIAGIYRDLRKGLEDAKDEPGAADFYYGEMEMRRLAARGLGHKRNDTGDRAKGRRPSWTERRLLDAYWAISGYGLRAWRALTALTILLVGCAALFTMPVFAHLPAPPQVASVNLATGAIRYAPITQPRGETGTTAAVPFGTSLKFTSTESLTLIRSSGTPVLETTSAGTVLDIALRLLAPLLLGLALLAVRGRIKR
jgi:uncharacterized protein YjbI with pentapeptide repeats